MAEMKARSAENTPKKKFHTFVVCAYKKSPFLEECVRSLLHQTVSSEILIATSTSNDMIRAVAEKYKLELYVREGESDIRTDWNFAYDLADSTYVTLAHQDDLYHQDYVKSLIRSVEKKKDVTLFFSSYLPIRHGIRGNKDINCQIRRFLRLPVKRHGSSSFWKRAILSMGNSICCPSVTYNKEILGDSIFTSTMKFDIDWDTFYKLSQIEGEFVYYDAPLTYYRIHDGATSKAFIEDRQRVTEDRAMFRKFWPEWMIDPIMSIYKYAYKTYD